MAIRRAAAQKKGKPHYGLVCMTAAETCRFRMITRSRYLSLSPKERHATLTALYWDNLARLLKTLCFCNAQSIRLYRMPTGLFPMSDESPGRQILQAMAANLSAVGRLAERAGIRVVNHPDQFVVLNSENPSVVQTGRIILEKEALAMDLMGLPRTPWSTILIHGGKAGRGDQLVDEIARLPEAVRQRLSLENDEYAYGARELLAVCKRSGVPMVFDCHHHVIKESLESYNHPEIAHFTRAAAQTWPDPDWQIVHLSNGGSGFRDRRHSELITDVPAAYSRVPWIEVEAKGKERAIAALRSGSCTEEK